MLEGKTIYVEHNSQNKIKWKLFNYVALKNIKCLLPALANCAKTLAQSYMF
jgi:hypothetical protein